MERTFSLLDKPWIKVIDMGMNEKEISLKELFHHAHELRHLAGETAEQDVAMLRLLISIVVTALYRYHADGSAADIPESYDEVMDRCAEYMKDRKFPEAIIQYLESQRDKFNLFDPSYPFFQTAGLDTEIGESGFKPIFEITNNQSISANNDTETLFRMTSKENANRLSFEEAARWIVFFQSYAHTVKRCNKVQLADAKISKPKTTTGKVGSFAALVAAGKNIYETIMLNLCALKNGMEVWGSPNPAWEQPPCKEQLRSIAIPDNLPELYTVQSRRALLRAEGDQVTGIWFMWGDSIEQDDENIPEQMAMWKYEKKGSKWVFSEPGTAETIWKEFGTIACIDSKRAPGTVYWINQLRDANLYNEPVTRFKAIGHVYSGQGSYRSFGDTAESGFSLATEILTKNGEIWANRIADEITKCCSDKSPIGIGTALDSLSISKKNHSAFLKTRYFELIDNEFRQWLVSIKSNEPMEEKILEWEKRSHDIAKSVARDYYEKYFRPGNGMIDKEPVYVRIGKNLKKFKTSLIKIYPALYPKKSTKKGEKTT